MKPLRDRLQRMRQQLKVPWEVLERDYVLSWVLAGLVSIEELRNGLVFKGGTALKKCYFGDYRFSEDLDFSATATLPSGTTLDAAIREACEQAVKLAQPYAALGLDCERYIEREPHPEGQDAYTIRATLPWHREPRTRVSIEITRTELLINPAQLRPILHGYEEPLEAQLWVYALEEIVLEKLRAILQHRKALETRGWSRSRARDYYDLWRILGTYEDRLDLTTFSASLKTKCALRGVDFDSADAFFDATMLRFVKDTWEDWLGSLVPQLPPFEVVVGELRPKVTALLESTLENA